MDIWLINATASFVISLLLTGIIIPQILLIAFHKKLFDEPDERKIHKGVVPRLGGIAFMPAIFFSLMSVVGFNMLYDNVEVSRAFADNSLQACFVSCSLMMMFLVGIADDLIGVKYSAKFVVQILAAMFIIASGVWINNLHGFCGLHELHPAVGIVLTVLVIVFIVNAVNLIDGIDGLASGLSGIALLFYGVIFYIVKDYFYSLLSFAVLGTLVPFFYYNVFGNAVSRKKIFMGDTGSLTIGIVLAFLSIKMSRMADANNDLHLNPIVMAFSPLIVPCFDVLRVYFHRIIRRRNPFLPDKCHIHHKILALGIPQRVTMILILIVSAAFISVNVLLSPYVNVTILVIADIVVWTVANMLLTRAIHHREERLKLKEKLYD